MPEGFIQEFLFFRDSQEGEKGKLGGNKPARNRMLRMDDRADDTVDQCCK
jgi:hypothetical protein